MLKTVQFKVIQGHRCLYQSSKALCNFLLVINTDILSYTVSKLSQIIVHIFGRKPATLRTLFVLSSLESL